MIREDFLEDAVLDLNLGMEEREEKILFTITVQVKKGCVGKCRKGTFLR